MAHACTASPWLDQVCVADASVFLLFAIASWAMEAIFSHNPRRAKDVRVMVMFAIRFSSPFARSACQQWLSLPFCHALSNAR